MLDSNSNYIIQDNNGAQYLLRSLNADDTTGIWFDSLSKLNPGLTEVSRIPTSSTNLRSILDNASPSNIWLAVVNLKNPSEHVANIHIGPINYYHRMTFFGRYIFEPYRGLGLGTAISKLVVKYCFEELNLRKVKAGNIGNNIAARKSNEKAGLTLDYIEKNSLFHNGRYHDSVVYSIFNNNYLT